MWSPLFWSPDGPQSAPLPLWGGSVRSLRSLRPGCCNGVELLTASRGRATTIRRRMPEGGGEVVYRGASDAPMPLTPLEVDFRILGPLEAVVRRAPVPLGGPKQRAVLAVLLLRLDEV